MKLGKMNLSQIQNFSYLLSRLVDALQRVLDNGSSGNSTTPNKDKESELQNGSLPKTHRMANGNNTMGLRSMT